LEGRQATAF